MLLERRELVGDADWGWSARPPRRSRACSAGSRGARWSPGSTLEHLRWRGVRPVGVGRAVGELVHAARRSVAHWPGLPVGPAWPPRRELSDRGGRLARVEQVFQTPVRRTCPECRGHPAATGVEIVQAFDRTPVRAARRSPVRSQGDPMAPLTVRRTRSALVGSARSRGAARGRASASRSLRLTRRGRVAARCWRSMLVAVRRAPRSLRRRHARPAPPRRAGHPHVTVQPGRDALADRPRGRARRRPARHRRCASASSTHLARPSSRPASGWSSRADRADGTAAARHAAAARSRRVRRAAGHGTCEPGVYGSPTSSSYTAVIQSTGCGL